MWIRTAFSLVLITLTGILYAKTYVSLRTQSNAVSSARQTKEIESSGIQNFRAESKNEPAQRRNDRARIKHDHGEIDA